MSANDIVACSICGKDWPWWLCHGVYSRDRAEHFCVECDKPNASKALREIVAKITERIEADVVAMAIKPTGEGTE